MIDIVFNKVFTEIMPILAPVVFVVSAFVVADQVIDLMRNAFTGSRGNGRRGEY